MEFIAFCPRTHAHRFGLQFILHFPHPLSLCQYFPALSLRSDTHNGQARILRHTYTTVTHSLQRCVASSRHASKCGLRVKATVELQKGTEEGKWRELAPQLLPSPPGMTLSAVIIRLVSREDPWLQRKKKGRESLGRKVCVLVCLYVCAGLISTSFNPPYPCTSYPHSPAKNQWQTPVKTEYLTFKAKSRGTYQLWIQPRAAFTDQTRPQR